MHMWAVAWTVDVTYISLCAKGVKGLRWIMFFGPMAQRWDQQGHSAPKNRKKEMR